MLRLSRVSPISLWPVVYWLPSPPDLDNVEDLTDMSLRERNLSSTLERSRPRRENKLKLLSLRQLSSCDCRHLHHTGFIKTIEKQKIFRLKMYKNISIGNFKNIFVFRKKK